MNGRSAFLKSYYRQIMGYLPCTYGKKKWVRDEIRCSVEAYLEEHPEAGAEAITARFGEPKRIAAAYVSGMDTASILLRMRRNNRLLRLAMALVITAVMGCMVLLALYML